MREQEQQTTPEATARTGDSSQEQQQAAGGDRGREEGTSGTAQPNSRAARAEDGSREDRASLFSSEEAERYRARWDSLQTGFVDEPRQMVEQADNLVDEVLQRLTAGFSEKRSNLEAHWEQGDEVSTEELRVALTRYRSFFNRLLSA